MENDNTNENAQAHSIILSNNEVLDAAVRLMDKYDEAFKELAK